ncbi:DUF1289 domain-containing protein [Ideonella sp. A 288]|uniref:DUF1289 domain-containing protein n=1 Tax=Ideonella sp. A 288 TaxID=1962181 RepID=UPI000B4AE787|nr:DUF1289 domain-containing protein [Ideonella sp. A 288]
MTTATAVESPCVNRCRMDAGTGWCEGCLRTIDEIVAWGRLGDEGRRRIIALLPERWAQWPADRPFPGATGAPS